MIKKKLIIYSSSLGQDGVGSLTKTIVNGLKQHYDVRVIKPDLTFKMIKVISKFNQEKSLVLPGSAILVLALLRFLGMLCTNKLIVVVDTIIPQKENVSLIKRIKLSIYNISYMYLNKRSYGVIYSYTKALITRDKRYSSSRETVIYHPTYASEACQERSEKYDFAWVGRLTPNKNPLMFLEALYRITISKKFEVVILGNGPLKPVVLNHKLFKDKKFSITYIESLDDVSSLYCQVKILVSTSLIEGCSMVLKEALKAGCVIVAPDTNSMGPRDLVECYGGYLFQPGNLDELVMAMKRASSTSKNLRHKSIIPNEQSLNKYKNFIEG